MDYLTREEVAAQLGVTPQRVSVLLRTGALKGEKVGSRWLVRTRALDAYQPKKPGYPEHRPRTDTRPGDETRLLNELIDTLNAFTRRYPTTTLDQIQRAVGELSRMVASSE